MRTTLTLAVRSIRAQMVKGPKVSLFPRGIIGYQGNIGYHRFLSGSNFWWLILPYFACTCAAAVSPLLKFDWIYSVAWLSILCPLRPRFAKLVKSPKLKFWMSQLELEYHDLLSLFEFLDNGATDMFRSLELMLAPGAVALPNGEKIEKVEESNLTIWGCSRCLCREKRFMFQTHGTQPGLFIDSVLMLLMYAFVYYGMLMSS